MKMDGTTCGFLSRCPTVEELHSCRTFIVSDENHWDPSDVKFILSMSRKLEPSQLSRHIFMVPSVSPSAPPTVLHQDNAVIHEFDLALSSSGLAPDLYVDKLKSDVQVNTTFSKDRHHGTDPNLLARKWGIGIQKTKDTLKCTTQLNFRSAILPLTRRYRTDLLQLHCRRLNTSPSNGS